MDVRAISRKSIHEDIVLQIKGMIERGELQPGDKLPAERALATLFAVSRNTVREAIKVLAETDVLESRQGAGTFVRDASTIMGPTSYADAILRGHPGIRDVFEVRKLIEPEVAALAARNASPEDITRLELILRDQASAVETGRPSGGFDQQFHRLLAEASGNAVLREMMTALHDDFSESRAEELQSLDRQVASLAAHRAIVDAVKNGHVMQAEKSMREHLDEVEAIVFSVNK